MDERPLADRVRPASLSEFIGQGHLLGEGEILSEIVKNKRVVSLILWGPPGSGKTTLARIIARETDADFIEISAVNASKADVNRIVERAKANRALDLSTMRGGGEAQTELYQAYSEGAPEPTAQQRAKSTGRVGGSADKQTGATRRTILFVDEIHRFNKAQQDAFLPHVESGLITLIGATTENPSFEVITPLLSRSRVLVLDSLEKNDILKILNRALNELKAISKVDKKALDYLAEIAGGDARVALGNLELALSLAKGKKVTVTDVKTASQRKLPGYDKQGEYHYNLISAFIKSMRGGDASAALYYLARMLDAGEDPKFIARRMVVFASEDIGLAAPAALNLAVSTFMAVERVGLPECQYNLYHCALVLSKTKKSRQVTVAMGRAQQAARDYPNAQVPLHLRNAPTKLMKDLGYQKGAKWQAGFKHPEGFLPDELKDIDIV